MNLNKPFIDAIIANPDDDAPRLIYADFLDENGEPDRAEFIRLSCKRDSIGKRQHAWENRAADILFSHPEWHRPFTIYIPILDDGTNHPTCNFERGFIDSITCTADDWIDHGDAICEEHPVREVRITTPFQLEYQKADNDETYLRLIGDKWISPYQLSMEIQKLPTPPIADSLRWWNRDDHLLVRIRWPGITFHLP